MRALHYYFDVPREALELLTKDKLLDEVGFSLVAHALKTNTEIGHIDKWSEDIEHHVYDDDGNPTGETIPMTRFVAEALIIEESA